MVKTARMIYIDPTNLTYSANTILQDAVEDLDGQLLAHTVLFNAIDAETGAIYVDDGTGLDTQLGDELHPVATITQAIVLATAAGGAGRIVVAAGTYAEATLTPPDNWSIVGRDRDTVILTGDAPATPVIILNGAGTQRVEKVTINPVITKTCGIQCNDGVGTSAYWIEQVQITPVAASATVGIIHTAGTTICREVIVLNVATCTGEAVTVAAGAFGVETGQFTADVNVILCDTGAITLQDVAVICINTGTASSCISLTTAGDCELRDVTLNNQASGVVNGYGIDSDESATNMILYDVRIQNNGTYVAVGGGASAIHESAAGNETCTFVGLACPPADFGITGTVASFIAVEAGVQPSIYPDCFHPAAQAMFTVDTPWTAVVMPDLAEAVLTLAYNVSRILTTILTQAFTLGGPGVAAIDAYAGGNIIALP